MGIPSKGLQVIVIESVMLALDFVVIGLRLWSRRLQGKSLEFNDYSILVGLVWILSS